MARLTPLNYNQQVVDPLTRAMEGYQSGLAARTQRESVALQREQAAQASELRGLQMEQMRASIQAQEAATARKAQMDQDVAAVLDNPSLEGWQNLVTKYPELDETFQSRISAMEDEEKQVLGQDLVTMNSFLQSGDTSALTDFLTQKRDAALNSGDSEKVELFENALETLSVGDTGLDILRTTIQGMAAINFGDNEAMMRMFFPEDQKPTALMQNIDARLKAEAAAGDIGPPGSDTWNRRKAELYAQEAQAAATRGQNNIYINTSLEGGEGDEISQLLDVDENGRATVLAGDKLSMFAIPGSEAFAEMFRAAEGQFTTTNQTTQMASALRVIKDAGFIPEAGADKSWFDSGMAYAANLNDSRVGKFISGISGLPAAEAFQNIDALKSSLFTNMVTNSEIPSKALDTEKEAQRFLNQFGGKEYRSTITALANYDMVYGSGLFLQEALSSGAIDVETYNGVRENVNNFAMQGIAYTDNSSQREREELNTALGNAYESNQFRNQQFGTAQVIEGIVYIDVRDEQSGKYRLFRLRGGS